MSQVFGLKVLKMDNQVCIYFFQLSNILDFDVKIEIIQINVSINVKRKSVLTVRILYSEVIMTTRARPTDSKEPFSDRLI